MVTTRRHVIVQATAAFGTVCLAGGPVTASQVVEAMDALVGDAPVIEGGVSLTLPDIADDGFTVPIDVAAPGAVAITLFSDENPLPKLAKFSFGPLNGTQSASTRVRLARTQTVTAIAEMPGGTFRRKDVYVTVTVGGCGA